MPIDPFFGTLLASGLGFLGGAMDDEQTQQHRRSFTENSKTDPRAILAQNMHDSNSIGRALSERIKKPVQLRSRATSSVGRPSSIDPALLAREGIDFGAIFGAPRFDTGNRPAHQDEGTVDPNDPHGRRTKLRNPQL